MTATTFTTTTASNESETTTKTSRRPLLRAGFRSGVVAAVATTAIAAVASAADVSLAVAGEDIPLAGFAQMTLMWTFVGVGIAALLRRFAGSPRSAWTKVTVALVALSFVPDITADTGTSTKLVLMLTHVAAAAIVIPAIAQRLPEHKA